jgi:capsular exopolysaccharide synthesis family protein
MEKKFPSYDFDEFSMMDVRALLFKVSSYWKWFLGSLILAFFIIRYINASSERIYSLSSLITVKEERNPIFTSTTNIAFNWGGASDQVETIKAILTSRTHNEKVVKAGQFYMNLLVDGRYRMEDVYGNVPFKVVLNENHPQLLNTLLEINFLDENTVNIKFLSSDKQVQLYNYNSLTSTNYALSDNSFNQNYSLDNVTSELFSFSLQFNGKPNAGTTYYLIFNDFDQTVEEYKKIDVSTLKNGTSLITLKLDGPNKSKLVDYLNTTINVLEQDQIASKIKYAVKTKAYIDTLFQDMSTDLTTIEQDLGDFKQKQNIYNLSTEGSAIFEEIIQLDTQSKYYEDRLNYLNRLASYIENSHSINENAIPVPAVVDIEDSNIATGIGTLIAKHKTRENLLQTVTTDYPLVKQLDQEIAMEKNALLENIHNLKTETTAQLKTQKRRLGNSQAKLKRLPEKEQKLLNFERRYTITEQNYNYLKQKSYEAGTAIASNVSDIKIIDSAKDTGQPPFKPQTHLNTLIGLLLALVIPLIVILLKEYFNTKITTVEEIENTYDIPILGVIGNNKEGTNLVVFNSPKSVISEAYRALRSNVQFLLDRNLKSHVILTTSSISGEGKTLTSINLGSVFALSGKKTIIVGADLRKPKLQEEFNLNNHIGMVHYLIGEKTPEEIIQKTEYDNLDVLLSGPVPPNPSELLLSEATDNLLTYLKEHYDFIILDAPPIGVVSDAQELFKFSEVILYLVRQGHTEKGMLKQVENKYKRGEMKNVTYVLNDFTFNKRHGYGSGYGYGYGYNSYEYSKPKTDKVQNIFQKIFKRK